MARYKPYDLNQLKMAPLSYADQVVEGSFEHALNEIVEEHLDLSVSTSATPTTRRGGFAEACRRNVVFRALSADSRPHFTTIAAFVSELDREIAKLFGDVLLMASELGLIGREHFAVDGCKLPSNASKRWSGTHQELADKRKKLEAVATRIVSRHRERDGAEKQSPDGLREEKKIRDYGRKIEMLKEFLTSNEKKLGPTGNEQKSNLTDPDSAKMTSSRGVLQGYNGLAVVDDRAQVIVHAEAHGSGYEGHLLAPLLDGTREAFHALDGGKDILARVNHC